MPEEAKKERIHKRVHQQLKKGGWKLATATLLALLIISIFTGGFKDFFSPLSLGKQKAADQAVSYINENLLQPGTQATLEDISDEGSLYKVKLKIGDLDFQSYVTKDGKYLFPQGIDMTGSEEEVVPETETPTTGVKTASCEGVTKSNKPKVELFWMAMCPYGLQANKGLMPVLDLLGDKVDFDLRFVYYAMHGETEVKEQLNQYCIQKEQNDKLIPYLKCFMENGDSQTCLTKIKIDVKKLESCISTADKKFGITDNLNDKSRWLNGRFPLFNVDKGLNEKYGVGGSPTLVINGQETRTSRDPASLLSTVCCAFETQPTECKQALSTATPSPGFGATTTSGGSAGSCG